MSDYWCKVDLRFLEDEKTEEVGERFGPAGPLAMLALLLGAKAQNKGGKVDGTYRNLAHDTWVDRDRIEEILQGLIDVGFAEGELNGRYYRLTLPSYKRWNERQRKQELRQRKREEEECPDGVPTCPDLSENVPLDKTREEKTKQETTSSKTRAEVQEVYDAWVQATNRPGTALTEKRRKLIRDRLKDYPVEDLVDAVRGIGASKFHNGANDRRKRFNDIEIALRDGPHVERFRDEFRGEGLPGGETSLDYDPLIDG